MIGHVVEVTLVVLFPPLCLLGVLGLGRIEDSLGVVRPARAASDPPPILAVPTQRGVPHQIQVEDQTEDGSRSVTVSFGGSTNL
ncbi:MAG: hypothetical protein QM655_07625 [Nocardioidaceae bacterium]